MSFVVRCLCLLFVNCCLWFRCWLLVARCLLLFCMLFVVGCCIACVVVLCLFVFVSPASLVILLIDVRGGLVVVVCCLFLFVSSF